MTMVPSFNTFSTRAIAVKSGTLSPRFAAKSTPWTLADEAVFLEKRQVFQQMLQQNHNMLGEKAGYNTDPSKQFVYAPQAAYLQSQQSYHAFGLYTVGGPKYKEAITGLAHYLQRQHIPHRIRMATDEAIDKGTVALEVYPNSPKQAQALQA